LYVLIRRWLHVRFFVHASQVILEVLILRGLKTGLATRAEVFMARKLAGGGKAIAAK
jgi:hypothetical protein